MLALILTHCANTTSELSAGGPSATLLYWSTCVIGGAVLIAVVVLLGFDTAQRFSSVVLSVGGASLILAVIFCWLQPSASTLLGGELPGMRWSFNVAWGATLLLLAPVLLWLALSQLRRRSNRGADPEAGTIFRWGAPFVVNAFGMILANIVTLGVIILTAQLIGDGIVWEIVSFPRTGRELAEPIYLYPAMQLAVTYLSLGLLIVAVVAAALVLWGWWRAGRARRLEGFGQLVRGDYPGDMAPLSAAGSTASQAWRATAILDSDAQKFGSKSTSQWIRSIARWRFLGGIARRVSYLFTATVTVAMLTVVFFDLLFVVRGISTPTVATGIGVALAVLIPPAIVALVLRSWKQVDKRRIIGTLWDVGTFFPRSFHPFAPPSYSERAVPELLRRIWYLHDNGGRVLLACHSQGSIVAAASLLRRSPRNGADGAEPKIVLATFGSPLRKLYGWAFPAYFSPEELTHLACGETGIGPVQWRNFYYRTDYIGGPTVPSIDIPLPDPPTSDFIFGQPEPRVGSHTGYWTDPHLWAQIDYLAGQIVTPSGLDSAGTSAPERFVADEVSPP